MDKILCWNVRGINSQLKHREIKNLIISKRVGLVGLLETKVKNKNMGNLYSSLFSGWCFTTNNPWIDKGRIIVAWNSNMYTVDIRSCSSQFIHCSARATHMTGIFFITFVYGFNDGKLREQLWLDIQALAMKINEAWIILGDYQNERTGKKTTLKPSLSLRDCMIHCQMEDLKFSGCFYTWTNKQRPEDRVYSKIDRAMVNIKWTDQYTNSEAFFYP